ncbi:hypothetical protein RDI58_022654 [Solanum bulbocastanum]|uniref:Uncharacterized protein n=1 Tax=Solanum bulbocastanum TaxID=147425 RepID=A0AAN8T2G6_SOLBU
MTRKLVFVHEIKESANTSRCSKLRLKHCMGLTTSFNCISSASNKVYHPVESTFTDTYERHFDNYSPNVIIWNLMQMKRLQLQSHISIANRGCVLLV